MLEIESQAQGVITQVIVVVVLCIPSGEHSLLTTQVTSQDQEPMINLRISLHQLGHLAASTQKNAITCPDLVNTLHRTLKDRQEP